MSGRAQAYLLAALLGLVVAAWTFPLDFLFPHAGLPWAPVGDAAQHAIVQRYFLQDSWRWPPLLAMNLNTPEGLNIAFADGIPLLALPLKLIAAWLPQGFHGIGLWYAISCVLQPVAAVWALRGAGETRLLPAIGVALAALSTPAWLGRYGHAALGGHFLLLLSLGLYPRLVRGPRLWPAAVALSVATLLTHPYLMMMGMALLAAVPLTLLLRRDRGWIMAAAGLGACMAAVLLVMVGFGYFGAVGDGGYGRYAMNLLSPVWPYRSGLLPGLVTAEVDATGFGGWEGFNWLGAGLLLGLALALWHGGAWGLVRRHAGLALAMLALTVLAVSQRVGLGGQIVLDLGQAPAVLEQFRASGRFFWPVAYVLLIGTALLLARWRPWLVLALGLLQFADAVPMRAALHDWVARRPAWELEAAPLRALFATHERLSLFPTWPCIAPRDEESFSLAQQALALASETAIPVNTMQVARWRTPPVCQDAALAATPIAPGELRLFLPAARALAPRGCTAVGEALACGPVTPRSANAVPPDTAAGSSSR